MHLEEGIGLSLVSGRKRLAAYFIHLILQQSHHYALGGGGGGGIAKTDRGLEKTERAGSWMSESTIWLSSNSLLVCSFTRSGVPDLFTTKIYLTVSHMRPS